MSVRSADGGRSLSGLDWVRAALALAVIAWLNVGVASFATSQVPNYARWGVFAVWLGAAIFSERGFALLLLSQCWPLLVLATYMLIASQLGGASIALFQNGTYYLLAVYSIYLFYFKEKYRPIQKAFLAYLLLDALVTGVNTYVALAQNPMLARYLATAGSTRTTILGEQSFYGVGGYGYVYSLGAIIVALTFAIMHGPRLRVLKILALAAASLLLVQAAFSIAIGLVVLIAGILFLQRASRRYGRVSMTLVGLTLLVGLFAVSGPVLRFVSTIGALPEAVTVRVSEVAAALASVGKGGSDLSMRLAVYEQSWTAFQHNVLFGTAIDPLTSYAAGGHASWIDLLATFGLFAATMFIFLFRAYRFVLGNTHDEGKALLNLSWLYFIVLGVVNPLLFANIFTTWFLLLPLWAGLMGRAQPAGGEQQPAAWSTDQPRAAPSRAMGRRFTGNSALLPH